MTLTCIIVDDDRIQRELMVSYVKETSTLELLGSFENPVDARNFLVEHSVDLLFLDIEMPRMNGFELLSGIAVSPYVIVVSSEEKYALESYEYDIQDFLKKPVPYARFSQAIRKVTTTKENDAQNYSKEIFVKVNSVIEKIELSQILFIEAAVDYIKIVTELRSFLVNSSMGSVLQKLPPNDFVRVHRSHIVRIDKIDTIDGNTIEIKDHLIRISKSFKDDIAKKINII